MVYRRCNREVFYVGGEREMDLNETLKNEVERLVKVNDELEKNLDKYRVDIKENALTICEIVKTLKAYVH